LAQKPRGVTCSAEATVAFRPMLSARLGVVTLVLAVAGGLGFFTGMATGQIGDGYGDTSEYLVGDTSLVYIPAFDMTVERDQAEGMIMDEVTDITLIPVER
jgi:hypothetical protein